jgi:hypothetical protein
MFEKTELFKVKKRGVKVVENRPTFFFSWLFLGPIFYNCFIKKVIRNTTQSIKMAEGLSLPVMLFKTKTKEALFIFQDQILNAHIPPPPINGVTTILRGYLVLDFKNTLKKIKTFLFFFKPNVKIW